MNNIRKLEINELVSNLKKRFDLHGKDIIKSDFERICQTENIKVFYKDFNCKGYYSKYEDIKLISIDSKLNESCFLAVAFHELGHHFLKHKLFSFDNLDKEKAEVLKLDNEADYFADLFLY